MNCKNINRLLFLLPILTILLLPVLKLNAFAAEDLKEKRIVGVEIIEVIDTQSEEVPLSNIQLRSVEPENAQNYTLIYLPIGLAAPVFVYFIIDRTGKFLYRRKVKKQLSDLQKELL